MNRVVQILTIAAGVNPPKTFVSLGRRATLKEINALLAASLPRHRHFNLSEDGYTHLIARGSVAGEFNITCQDVIALDGMQDVSDQTLAEIVAERGRE